MEEKPKVLVVDDEQSHRIMLRVVLGEEGYSVTEAADGEGGYSADCRHERGSGARGEGGAFSGGSLLPPECRSRRDAAASGTEGAPPWRTISALEDTEGKRTKRTADILGINRRTLQNKLKQYKLNAPPSGQT